MNTMRQDDGERDRLEGERAAQIAGDARWHRVYLLVIFTTVVVIAALWLFSKRFSS
ncbi:MAG TPA: hypothetical protein VM870_08350 [Pyrinomonadaceae bacterium]|nr:hypothetical protein [Pyrinomonadaceae bacterium]